MSVEIDPIELLRFISERWHRRSTIVLVLLLVTIVLLLLFSGIDFEQLSWLELLVIGVVLISTFLFWLFNTRLPRASNGKIGFAVAISTETKAQREQIAADFVTTLRELLDQSELAYSFSLVEFPQYHSRRIQSREDAVRYLHRANCKFMIYGRARTRLVRGEYSHILNLEGIVLHKMVSEDIKNRFSKEFAELFPRKLLVSQEDDVFKFEVTARWVDLVARYIIGTASLISGDVDYSQSVFEDLQQRIQPIQTSISSIKKIRRRLPNRLTDVYFMQARRYHHQWRQTRRKKFLAEEKPYLDQLERVAPDNYDANNLRAIWYFVVNRDVDKALEELQKSQGQRDGAWRYNQAFLLAYDGNMKKAIREYKKASKKGCDSRTLLEIEEFIVWMLDEEPDKIQLHMCLGLVNFFGKGDYSRALKDFEEFLEVAPSDRFPEAIRLANAYIGNIRGELNGVS